MRAGNVTGSVNAPVAAFTVPLPSITEPAQSTVTDLENVAISQLLRLGSNCRSRLLQSFLRFTFCRERHLDDEPHESQHDGGEEIPARRGNRIERVHAVHR